MSEDLLDFLEEDLVEEPDIQDYWTILVTDDDKNMHDVTRLALRGVIVKGKKLKIIDAYTGREAAEIVAKEKIDLMFLDVVMETEHAGITCAKFIKHDLKLQIPIIIIRSGFAGWELELNTDQSFLDDFIKKTESTQQHLIEKLEKWLK